jgi:hypothetical protein
MAHERFSFMLSHTAAKQISTLQIPLSYRPVCQKQTILATASTYFRLCESYLTHLAQPWYIKSGPPAQRMACTNPIKA